MRRAGLALAGAFALATGAKAAPRKAELSASDPLKRVKAAKGTVAREG